jgi:hypothetical protein
VHENRLQQKRRRRQGKRAAKQLRTRNRWRQNHEHPPKLKMVGQVEVPAPKPGAPLGETQFDAAPAPVESLTSKVFGALGL